MKSNIYGNVCALLYGLGCFLVGFLILMGFLAVVIWLLDPVLFHFIVSGGLAYVAPEIL